MLSVRQRTSKGRPPSGTTYLARSQAKCWAVEAEPPFPGGVDPAAAGVAIEEDAPGRVDGLPVEASEEPGGLVEERIDAGEILGQGREPPDFAPGRERSRPRARGQDVPGRGPCQRKGA